MRGGEIFRDVETKLAVTDLAALNDCMMTWGEIEEMGAGGQIIGASDEFGYKAEQQPIAVHDLHATMLHLLGIDHTRLTYLFNGRNMRLTDVYGELIPQIVA